MSRSPFLLLSFTFSLANLACSSDSSRAYDETEERLVAPGSIYAAYGTHGRSVVAIEEDEIFALTSERSAVAGSMIETTDGSLILLLAKSPAKGAKTKVIRLDKSGELDPAFGAGGVVLLDTGADTLSYVRELPSKKLLLTSGTTSVRLLADGSLDTTFGANGVRVVDDLALQIPAKNVVGRQVRFVPGAGMYFLASVIGGPYRIYRLDDEGSVDTSWNGGTGFAVGPSSQGVPASTVVDGRLYETLYSTIQASPFVKVRRYDASGADATYGIGGSSEVVPQSVATITLLLPLSGDRIGVVHGHNAITALDATGNLDPTVWQGGEAKFGPGEVLSEPNSTTIVRVGVSQSTPLGLIKEWSITRLLPDGKPDPSFVASRFEGSQLGKITFGKKAIYATQRTATWNETTHAFDYTLQVTKLHR